MNIVATDPQLEALLDAYHSIVFSALPAQLL